jgi:hypothetical protein
VLLITGKALPNVLGARSQLRSWARSTFTDLGAVTKVDDDGCHCLDRLTGEHPSSGRLF